MSATGASVAAGSVRTARAIHTAAVRVGADVDRLTDSKDLVARLAELEPLVAAPAFEGVVGAVVADFVASRPYLRLAGAST